MSSFWQQPQPSPEDLVSQMIILEQLKQQFPGNSSSALTPEASKVQQQQRLLRLMKHAHTCRLPVQSSGNSSQFHCVVPACPTMKNISCHLVMCTAGKNCLHPLCPPSISVTKHWRGCYDTDCTICVELETDAAMGGSIASRSSVKRNIDCVSINSQERVPLPTHTGQPLLQQQQQQRSEVSVHHMQGESLTQESWLGMTACHSQGTEWHAGKPQATAGNMFNVASSRGDAGPFSSQCAIPSSHPITSEQEHLCVTTTSSVMVTGTSSETELFDAVNTNSLSQSFP
ncbi:uncharacterized protein LOC108667857 [Hyalella azteca]|uniref:histone acetyltransferase n=1 Tax=Hyalella azteca TaxID=294128 RepID=A0A8B7NA29_HYAAZ|nr:uncharacterized protein LOC108667857 [Hyalella azteca]